MLKKNLFYNSILSASQFIFPLITFPYVSRILGPKGIGSVNFIDSITQYFVLFAALGIPTYGVREIAKAKKDTAILKKVYSEIITIHFISTSIFSLIYILIGLIVPNLKIHFDLVLVGVALMFFNLLAGGWIFQGLENFSYIATRSLAIRCISILLLFVFLKRNSSPLTYYLILASGTFLTSLSNLLNVGKHVQFTYKSLELRRHIKPLVIILGSSLAVSVYILMDNILLGFMRGDEAVGLYSTAIRIVRIPFAIFGAISGVMVPQISQAYHNQDFGYIHSLISKSFAFVCIAAIPISMGIFVSASFLVNTFAGKNFQGSILALQILSPVIILVGLNNLFGIQLLIPMGKDKLLFSSVFAGMIASLVLNLCLIPFFSFIGTSVTNMLTECVVTLMTYLFAKRYIKMNFDFRLLLQCVAASLAFIPISFAIRLLGLNLVVEEVLVIVFCVIFYFLFVWLYLRNEYVENFKEIIISKFSIRFS